MNRKNKKAFKMDDKDNVATSLENIEPGDMFNVISEEGLILETNKAISNIPFGYKVALKKFSINDSIIKYGYKIGSSFKEIKKGEVVHIHNIKSDRVGLPENRRKIMIDMLQKEGYQINWVGEILSMKFKGFRRKNGQVGVRNYYLVIGVCDALDGIVNNIARKYENVLTVTSEHGCPAAGNEQVINNLAGLSDNPNVVGTIIIGMGCEGVRPEMVKAAMTI